MSEKSSKELLNLSDSTSPDLNWKFISSALKNLTPPELRVAKLAAQGLMDREIDDRLGYAKNVSKVYMTKIYAKLKIKDDALGNPRVLLSRIFSDSEKHMGKLEDFESGLGI